MDQHATVVCLPRQAQARWTRHEMRLSLEGAEAVEELADHLAAGPITHVASSDSLRARQAVAPIARRLALPVVIESDLRERRLTTPTLPARLLRGENAFRGAVRAT